MPHRNDRRIQVNNWLIKARWFYTVGIVAIAMLMRVFGEYNFPYSIIFTALIVAISVNLINFFILSFAKKTNSEKITIALSYWQILFEVFFFAVIFYFAGGLESRVALFFFLPIISAGYFFDMKGAFFVALLSGISIISIVFMEFAGIIPHLFRYGIRTIHYTDFSIAMSYAITYCIFYTIIGAYSGHISRMLIRREDLLYDKTKKLDKESEYRKNEWSQLDKTAKLLVKRDRELVNANDELDKKVKELQHSEVAMMKAFRDLQENKKALENEKNRTNAIIENIIDPVIVINKNNELELLNQSARVVFNFTEDDFGKKVDEKDSYSMENFRDITSTEFKVKHIKDESTEKEIEEVVIEIAGQETTYKVVTAKVIDKEGAALGTMKIFYNLTREKMLDKLKSEFISIAAHQLRTPLSAIKWVIKMVLDEDAGSLNDDQKQLLAKGYKSNERIITLVNDMLNVSRIEEGRFGYNIKKDNLLDVFDIVYESLEKLIENKFIKLTINKAENFPLLNIDAKNMTLVMQNLFENAIKYTPEHGKIKIDFEVEGQFVKFKIKDNGIGIPKADQVKLFSKFYRAENALRLQTEGSGLGLFIVKNIIKTHGGDITFNSEEGMGTEFIITLPIDYVPKIETSGKNVKSAEVKNFKKN